MCIKICPECGAKIVYSYNPEHDSYYLRCKKNYKHWSKNCSKKETASYDKLVCAQEAELNSMRDAINDDDCDYYHGW